MAKTPRLTPDHTRVLERLEDRGSFTPAHAALYPELSDLVQAGLVDVHADGTYTPAGGAAPRAVRPRAPRPEPFETLAVRVPSAWLDRLEAIGPSRSDAARALIAKGLGVAEFRPRGAPIEVRGGSEPAPAPPSPRGRKRSRVRT